jgi:N-acetylglucosaminyldiphosphoundecaprenol N-acetyl-beta-D-mannosaminyltransferase
VNKKRVVLGLIEVDTYPPKELTDHLVYRSLTSTSTRHVVTANAQFYVMAERLRRFRRCLERAEYVCADGFSIQLACRWLAKTAIARCPGVDLVHDLCQEGANYGLRVYLLGGLPGAAEDSARILSENYPGLNIVGTDCPPMHFEKDPEKLGSVLSRLAHARPQVVFVGLGAPKQEYFIDQHIRRGRHLRNDLGTCAPSTRMGSTDWDGVGLPLGKRAQAALETVPHRES